jgi:hypothetical protein
MFLRLYLTLTAALILICGCTASLSTSPVAKKANPGGARFSRSAYVGEWAGGGRGLNIDAEGSISAQAMTYRTCGQDYPPCDAGSGASLKPGAIANGKIVSFLGDNLKAIITSTTDPNIFPVGPTTIIYSKRTDSITMDDMSFCGVHAKGGYCGF